MSWLRRWTLGRLGDEALCRRLTLEGWEHLVAANGGGKGVVLLSPGDDLWPVTVAAVGLYLGPLEIVAPESRLRELPGSWRRRFVRGRHDPGLELGDDDRAAAFHRGGGRILFLSGAKDDDLGERLSADLPAWLLGAAVFKAVTGVPRKGRYKLTLQESR